MEKYNNNLNISHFLIKIELNVKIKNINKQTYEN